MEHPNQHEINQFLALAKEVRNELSGIERTSEDDEMDMEYKRGLTDALHKFNEILVSKIESLIEEQK